MKRGWKISLIFLLFIVVLLFSGFSFGNFKDKYTGNVISSSSARIITIYENSEKAFLFDGENHEISVEEIGNDEVSLIVDGEIIDNLKVGESQNVGEINVKVSSVSASSNSAVEKVFSWFRKSSSKSGKGLVRIEVDRKKFELGSGEVSIYIEKDSEINNDYILKNVEGLLINIQKLNIKIKTPHEYELIVGLQKRWGNQNDYMHILKETTLQNTDKDNHGDYNIVWDVSEAQESSNNYLIYLLEKNITGEVNNSWWVHSAEKKDDSFVYSLFSIPLFKLKVGDPSNEDFGDACVPISYTGDSKENLDLVFVGDKYETNKFLFEKDINLITKDLLGESTFNAYRNRINLWRVDDFSGIGCKYDKDCVPGGIIGTLVKIGDDDNICCERTKTMELANECPNDFVVAIDQTPPEISNNLGVAGQAYYEIPHFFTSKASPLKYVIYPFIGNPNKFLGLAVVDGTIYSPGRTVSHELGHMIAKLPDYYKMTDSCEKDYPCMMCSSHTYDFGNQGKCVDRARMVEQLNQFCEAEVTIANSVRSPYPNPYNPNKCNIKSEKYPELCTQKVRYKVEYPEGADPCYILMHIYDTKGAETRVLVSDEPQPAGEYEFEWDGTNNERVQVASGTYFYIVSGGGDSKTKTLKGTLVK